MRHCYAVNTDTNTVVATIPVDNTPSGVAVTPDGKSAYVVNLTTNTISTINTATNTLVNPPIQVVQRTLSDLFGIAMTPDGKFAYVTETSDGVWVNNTGTNAVVGSPIVTATGGNTAVAVTPNGKFV